MGGYQETVEGTMDMPDDDAEAFARLVTWLYSSKLPKAVSAQHQMLLYNLYILAERLLMTELADRTIDLIRKNHEATFTVVGACRRHLRHIGHIYNRISENSPLRTFAIHMMAYDYWKTQVCDVKEGEPLIGKEAMLMIWETSQEHMDFFHDFFSRILMRPAKHRLEDQEDPFCNPSKNFCCYDACFFHRHAEDEVCHLCFADYREQSQPTHVPSAPSDISG